MSKRVRTGAPPGCEYCEESHQSLNGRWCRRLRRYVEYARSVPCAGTKEIVGCGRRGGEGPLP